MFLSISYGKHPREQGKLGAMNTYGNANGGTKDPQGKNRRQFGLAMNNMAGQHTAWWSWRPPDARREPHLLLRCEVVTWRPQRTT